MNAITLNITFNSIDDLQTFMAGRSQPQAAPVDPYWNADDSLLDSRFRTHNLPVVGANVHWAGARFDFDGVVDRTDEGADEMSDKCVWVRRNDTGKLVSLTGFDLNEYGILTAI